MTLHTLVIVLLSAAGTGLLGYAGLLIWRDGRSAGRVEGIELGLQQQLTLEQKGQIFRQGLQAPPVQVIHNYYGQVRQLPAPKRDERGQFKA